MRKKHLGEVGVSVGEASCLLVVATYAHVEEDKMQRAQEGEKYVWRRLPGFTLEFVLFSPWAVIHWQCGREGEGQV